MKKYTENFDKIVAHVKKEGDFSSYGAYLTYGYVSVSNDGKKIQLFEGHDREGHYVTLTRGSYIAEATVNLRIGQAKTTFDIRSFVGDAGDMLSWDNDPSLENAYQYNAAIAQIFKNISNYDFYIGGFSFKDIGFKSYIY